MANLHVATCTVQAAMPRPLRTAAGGLTAPYAPATAWTSMATVSKCTAMPGLLCIAAGGLTAPLGPRPVMHNQRTMANRLSMGADGVALLLCVRLCKA